MLSARAHDGKHKVVSMEIKTVKNGFLFTVHSFNMRVNMPLVFHPLAYWLRKKKERGRVKK